MKLRFVRRAAKDLSAISAYLRRRNPAGAKRVRADILESVQTLVLFPGIGREQKLHGIRRLVTRKYGYLVYYIVDEMAEEIIVLTVQHPARERVNEGL
jgi:toxin ParE1/3/4